MSARVADDLAMAWQATKARGQTDPNARRRRLATDRVRGAALVGEYAFERNITTVDVMKKPGEQPKPTDATPRLLTIAQGRRPPDGERRMPARVAYPRRGAAGHSDWFGVAVGHTRRRRLAERATRVGWTGV